MSVEPTPVENAPSAPYVQADDPLLRQKSVLYSNSADIIKMLDAVLFCKIAGYYTKLRRFNILAWCVVIERNDDFFVVKDLCKTGLLKNAYGYRRGDVIAEYYVEFCLDQITCVDFRKSCVSRKDLLCHCHAHDLRSLLFILPLP